MLHWLIGAACGALIGVTLGLVGGGGSILAMPLIIHVMGVSSTHVAIGTAAVAVTANAFANLALIGRRGLIKWRCVIVFASSGVVGAAVGAALGKLMNGAHLQFLFGLLMIVVGALMFRSRNASGDEQVRLDRTSAPYLLPRLLGLGFATGAMSGFFGIGGGFLIVPGLILATDMPMIMAVASSLVAITAFGLTTSVSYALSGLVDWPLAGVFILGGVLGGVLGGRFARHLASKKDLLARVFAVVVAIVGAYVCVTSWSGAN